MSPGNQRTKIYMLVLLTAIVAATIFSLKHIPQSQAFHHFCDQRSFLSIPNFANVISNIIFVFSGLAGLLAIRRSDAIGQIKVIYTFLFLGMLLTAAGSAYYHWAPDNDTLVFD